MTWVLDVLAIVGGAFIVAGVFLEFGLAYSFIVAGLLLVGLALRAAKVQEDANVTNSE